jgi:hypothetical protein
MDGGVGDGEDEGAIPMAFSTMTVAEKLRDSEYKRRCKVELLVFNLQQTLYPPQCSGVVPERHLRGCLRCFLVSGCAWEREPSSLPVSSTEAVITVRSVTLGVVSAGRGIDCQPEHYLEVVEERASNFLCGYPLCDKRCVGLEK